MADLSEAMGLSKPSVYVCFGNKEELFRRSLDLYEREKLQYFGKALAAPTVREIVAELMNGALMTHSGAVDPRGCLGVISTVTCTPDSDPIRQHVEARRLVFEAALVERLQLARENDDLPPGVDAEALAGCITTMLQGITVKAQARVSSQEIQRSVDAFLALWPG